MKNEEKIASLEKKIKVLQRFYAAALADSAFRYGNAGIIAEIEKQKYSEQVKSGKAMAVQFGVKEPKEAFKNVQDLFNCANWVCEDIENGFMARNEACMLCIISKKMGPHSPCKIHCLNPLETIIKSVSPYAEFIVEKTLWDDNKCEVKVLLK